MTLKERLTNYLMYLVCAAIGAILMWAHLGDVVACDRLEAIYKKNESIDKGRLDTQEQTITSLKAQLAIYQEHAKDVSDVKAAIGDLAKTVKSTQGGWPVQAANKIPGPIRNGEVAVYGKPKLPAPGEPWPTISQEEYERLVQDAIVIAQPAPVPTNVESKDISWMAKMWDKLPTWVLRGYINMMNAPRVP